jgi:hypothetical protein
MKPFIRLPQYVISHGERITRCYTLGDLSQAMFSGPENLKLYDDKDGTDST